MIVSRKIAEMFKRCGFVNIDYLVENKLETNPSKILNIINRDWRKWVKPLCMLDGGDPLDPNFGNETAGFNKYDGLLDDLYGTVFTSPSDVDKAVSLTFSCKKDTGTAYAKGVIVLHSNLNIITNGKGQPVQFDTTKAWKTSSFSTQPTLSPNINYVLMAIASASYFGFYYTDHISTDLSHHDFSNSYSSPTNPTDATHDDYMFSIYCAYTTSAIIKSWAESLNVSHALSRPYRSMKLIPTLKTIHTFTRPARFMKLTQNLTASHTLKRHRVISFSQTLKTLHEWTLPLGLILKQWFATLQITHTFKRPLRQMKFTQILQTVHTLTLKRFFKFAQALNLSHILRRPYRKIEYIQTLQIAHAFSRPFRAITFPASLQLTYLFTRPSRFMKLLETLGLIHEWYVVKPGVEPMKLLLKLGPIALDLKTGKIMVVI